MSNTAPRGNETPGPGANLLLASAGPAWDRWPDIAEYTGRIIGSQPFWDTLVQAIIGEVEPMPNGPACIVLADNPLLAMAGAAAASRWSGRNLVVPMRSAESPPLPETLPGTLRQFGPNESLHLWLKSAPAAADQESSVLMRAWGVSRAQLASEMADTPAPLRDRLVALITTSDPAEADLLRDVTVFNLTGRLRAIACRVVAGLALPAHAPCTTAEDAGILIQRLLREDGDLPGILRQLNTPDHYAFQTAAWRLDGTDRPETTRLFEDNVLAGNEDRPRHAAALFLVSHFGRIPPAQLAALGDLLARSTPAAKPGRDASRPPSQITDKVLTDCDIGIVRGADRSLYAVLGAHKGATKEEPISIAAYMKNLFQRQAPLLTERYLLRLAEDLTIGHPSSTIADNYLALELDALRSTALDGAAARDRLVRIAYAHPALMGTRAPEDSEWHGLVLRLERLTERLPGFLASAAPAAHLPMNEAVGALCSAEPGTLDDGRKAFFSQSAARIFWACYAADCPGLTLRGFPALFDGHGGLAGRADLMECLRLLLYETTLDRRLQPIAGLMNGPAMLGRLMADAGRHFADMPEGDALRCALLSDAASTFLMRSLPRRPWRDVSIRDAAADLPLAQALLNDRTPEWWCNPGDRVMSGEAPNIEEVRRIYRIARTVIEALAGSAWFEEEENLAIDVWLVEALTYEQINENIQAEWFHNGLLWAKALRGQDAAFHYAVFPLLNCFPLIVLMAATCNGGTAEGAPVFSLSDPLRDWLLGGGDPGAKAPLMRLDGMLQQAHTILAQWRKAHDHWFFHSVDRARLVAAFRDREAGLRAFEQLIRPLIQQSLRNPPSARPQGGFTPPPATKPE